ncbi:hypothetical protein CDAR_393661 [Caerostris darwini]|uniref:Uncharacterized protein n=1 Tax=Caerostris darwini TaxID=1538125 RepID=A0AAV4W6Y1_9ARAC|nr:hypothetical protein CDAR_393661 [Caerostris darwini]
MQITPFWRTSYVYEIRRKERLDNEKRRKKGEWKGESRPGGYSPPVKTPLFIGRDRAGLVGSATQALAARRLFCCPPRAAMKRFSNGYIFLYQRKVCCLFLSTPAEKPFRFAALNKLNLKACEYLLRTALPAIPSEFF